MLLKSGAMSKIFGGFRINAITQYQQGFPLGIQTTGATGQQGLSFISLRPNINGSAEIEGGTREQQIAQWFNTSIFSNPAIYAFGNAPRTLSDVRGPSFFGTNMNLQRTFDVTEKTKIQLRAEAFNVFNQVNFRNPGTTFGGAAFGVIPGAEGPRRMQLSAKFIF